MEKYRVAEIERQGTNFLIFPVDGAFGGLETEQKKQVIERLSTCAQGAGLSGVVVPIWNPGNNRLLFEAPDELEPLFRVQGFTLDFIERYADRELSCGDVGVKSRQYGATEETVRFMLEKAYRGSNGGVTSVFLMYQDDATQFTYEQWNDTYNALRGRGLIRNIGTMFATMLEQEGIETAKRMGIKL